MRFLLYSSLALLVMSTPTTVLAQQRNLCTHATRSSGPGCPSPGPGVKPRIDLFDRVREQQELRATLEAALAKGDCEGARKTAVNMGRHELAARIRRACKAQST